jgi:copper chaperone NosL
MMRLLSLIPIAVLLAACSDEAPIAVPQPITMTPDAVGHYCQMNVLDHDGPKAQVHLAGIGEPLWFSQVRDAFVFDRLPEETAEVAVIYVNDMGAAPSWEDPGVDNWIAADKALYVVGSSRRGGMGAPEFMPFADATAANRFAAAYGGEVVAYADITDEAVLAPVDVEPEALHHEVGTAHGASG